ncbi:MAG: ribonuclease H-like domain-containing protein [Candidatus Dormibacteria bacterium]
MSPDGAGRDALASLRARLVAMGGLADLSRPAGSRRAIACAPPAPPAQRAGALGFGAEGQVLVRRVSVDLGPFLARAGAPARAAPEDMVRLLYNLPGDAPGGRWAEDEMAVLDIETLGLRGSGVVPFLVGVGVPRGSALDIDQYLLADLEAEGAMLDAVGAELASRRILVTYNGRSFDVPVLQARCIVNRRSPDTVCPPLHCDLLAPVRRLFRERLGPCTLRQAETGLLGLDRGDDVPGAEAPARFRAWLNGAPPEVLDGVVRHNQFDLCATMVLAGRLVAHVAGRMIEPVHPADRYRLGVHMERIGLAEAADDHYAAAFQDAASAWSQPAGHRLARRRRRRQRSARVAGTPSAALPIFRELWRRHPDDLAAARGLAIALEANGELGEALAVCDEAEAVLAGRPLWWRRLAGRAGEGPEAEWSRRADRLRRRRSPSRRQAVLALGGDPSAVR